MFPMEATLTKNSQVIIAKWSQDILSLDGFKPKKKFFSQNHKEKSFWAVTKPDDLRPFLVFLVKISTFSTLTHPKTPNGGPKKISHS
jgi:hypothetical protein